MIFAKIELTNEGLKIGKQKIESMLADIPNITNLTDLFGEGSIYTIFAHFRDIEDFNNFMTSKENSDLFQKYIKIIELHTITASNIHKYDIKHFYHKILKELS